MHVALRVAVMATWLSWQRGCYGDVVVNDVCSDNGDSSGEGSRPHAEGGPTPQRLCNTGDRRADVCPVLCMAFTGGGTVFVCILMVVVAVVGR